MGSHESSGSAVTRMAHSSISSSMSWAPMQAGQAPAAIILLGDIDAPRPLHLELEAIRDLTDIYWIPGNHDSDDNNAWTNLVPAS